MRTKSSAAGHLLLAMFLIAVMLAAGCGSSGIQIVGQKADTVNLRFIGYKVGKSKVEEIDTILNRYMEENEDVVIVYEGIAENYVDIMSDRLQSGRAGDLFMIGDQAVSTYAANGWYGTKIADLSGEEFVRQYSPMIRKMITLDGQVPAVPMCLSTVGMLGNMDVLSACGIDRMPDTFNEWVRDMETVQEYGFTPMVNYQGNAASLSFLMAGRSVAAYVEGVKTYDEGVTAAEIFSRGITDIYGLIEAGLIDRAQFAAETEARAYQTVLGEEFASGGVAFAVAPSWTLTAFQSGEPEFEYRYAGLPVGDAGPLAGVRASVLVAVNNEGEHRKEAAAFLDFLMQPEHIERYAAAQTSLSPLAGAKTDDPLLAQPLALIEAGRIFSDTDARIPFNLLKLLNEATLQMADGEPLEQILTGFAVSVRETMSSNAANR